MKWKIRLQTKSIQKFFIDASDKNTKFKDILAIIICEILHPTTLQQVFPTLPFQILLSHGKISFHHHHQLGIFPYFQHLHLTIANILFMNEGLNFPQGLEKSMHRLYPNFGFFIEQRNTLLYLFIIRVKTAAKWNWLIFETMLPQRSWIFL